MKLNPFFSIKYFLAALAGVIGFVIALNISTNGYALFASFLTVDLGFDIPYFVNTIDLESVSLVLSFPELIGILGVFLISYFIAYIHEKIPHCASPWYELFWRFGGMLFIMILGILLLALPTLLSGPELTWYKIFFILDTSVLISAFVSIFIILTLYRFEPGKSVRKKGICTNHE